MISVIQECLNYVMHTPENTNPSILLGLLEKIYCSGFEDVNLYIDATDGKLYVNYPNNFSSTFSLNSDGFLELNN